MPQLRQNIITGEWVVIAPERAKRPSDFVEQVTPKNNGKDPFTAESEAYKLRVKGTLYETDNIYVTPNKYPAFLEDASQCQPRTIYTENGFYATRPGTGGHDVVIIKQADQSIYTFNKQTWFDFFQVARNRYRYWRNDCNTEYSMLIYNQGSKAGASVTHPHGQIFASNILPNQVKTEIYGSQQYFADKGTSVFTDMVAHEKKVKERLVTENDDFVVFAFFAARFPFETWLLPKKPIDKFELITESYLISLSEIVQETVSRYGKVLHNPDINFYLHDLPKSIPQASYYQWHIEFAPRVSKFGSYELGSGIVIDVMSPEEAAEYLRNC